MRIAHIMAGARSGGAELFYERLVAAQHAAGDEVLAAIRTDPARQARLRSAGLTPTTLPFGGLLDLVTRPRLARRLRAFQPDLVMAWMGRAAALTPKGPYTLIGRLGGYYDLARFRRCDHLAANTKSLQDWIIHQGWPPGRTHHLPNFVPDLAGAPPAHLPTPPGAPVILALGRLHKNKAFDVLVRALRNLPGAHAVIAGDGPERENLLALARAENVQTRLHLLGWRQDQAALLSAATVLACPSRQEPLGNVILEAFSARTPVVATAVPGPIELIRQSRTGLLVPPEDPNALAEAIATLIRDPTLASILSTTARTEFETTHAQSPVLARWRTTLTTLRAT